MTEEQRFDVVRSYDGWEVRRYPVHIVAEVTVDGDFDDAVSRGFRVLASYIFGENEGSAKVAMTAPVVQERKSETIDMTAPVIQGPRGTDHVVSFVMPSQYTMETLPKPNNADVHLREVSEHLAAVRQFSGRSTKQRFAEQLGGLLSRIEARHDLEVTGPPSYARFDPPWKPWFLRRNEVVVPVRESGPERTEASRPHRE